MSDHKVDLFKQSLEKHMTAMHLASQSYDKAILSLSTAVLGFTFAYIKLFPAVSHCCVLAFTWFFLIISIVFVLISFVIDQFHCSHKIKYCYWRILAEGEKIQESHWSDGWMIPFPILSGIFFVAGIVLFTIFVGINI